MSKTNIGLVEYVKSKLGTPYVYGTKMEVLTLDKYNWLKKTYGSMVWDSDKQKCGKVCCDCSGLISAYTGVVQGSSQMKTAAKACNPISTIKNAPIGAILWQNGHVGIYIGMENGIPYYIAEDGSAYGCRKNKLANAKFTHWLLMDYITYVEENNMSDEVKAAIEKLVKHGVISSPDYWLQHYGDVKYLDQLIINMGKKL